MNYLEASNLIFNLLSGYNFFTNEKLDQQKYFQQEETQAALNIAIRVLEQLDENTEYQWTPKRAGKKWYGEEDRRLVVAFDRGLTVNTLAASHQRTEGAIRDRLIMLGRGYR